MRRIIKQFGGAVLLCVCAAPVFAAEQLVIAPELWDRPRAARTVLEQAEIREAIRMHIAQPGSRIVIHHGYGPNPLLQAEELRAWLMTLAVDAARISLLNDVKPNEALKIEVLK